MPNYKYTVINDEGKKVKGFFHADNIDDVYVMIEEKNYLVIDVVEFEDKKDIDVLEVLRKIKHKDIYVFCRQFHTMIDAGANIAAALDVLRKQTENLKLRKAIDNVFEEVQKGSTLSEAMSKYNRIFPSLLVSMIETGEVSGNLDIILERMASHYENENKVNNKVKSAMMYPIILTMLSVAVVTFLMIFIMPIFVGIFESSGAELPALTKGFMALSKFLTSFWYLVLILLFFLGYGIKSVLCTPKGKYTMDKIKLKTPIYKKLLEKIIVARFTRTLATILSSGISLIQALESVEKVVGNTVVEEKLKKSREQVIRGVTLSTSLEDAKVFPPMLNSMIKIGEESGKLDEILDKTANFYDEELDTSIKQFTSLIEPLMMIIMGLVIGVIVLAMMMPMFDMYSNI
ncbi:type II secretion system F family protein [Clostridium sp.]|uniref:type II secretion system F family protein n=1 Tax=Clostridium sp. TaxID=1506 RepID=UPI002FC9910D